MNTITQTMRFRQAINEYFYATHKFYSFNDFAKQLKVHNYNYNKFPMCPLNWKAPIDCIKAFLEDGEIF